MREWLDAKPDPQFAEKCHDIYQTYRLAPERAAAGIPTFSIDEMTDIQALERIAPTLPVRPGRVERREFEYTRHGTCTLKPNPRSVGVPPAGTRTFLRRVQARRLRYLPGFCDDPA